MESTAWRRFGLPRGQLVSGCGLLTVDSLSGVLVYGRNPENAALQNRAEGAQQTLNNPIDHGAFFPLLQS